MVKIEARQQAPYRFRYRVVKSERRARCRPRAASTRSRSRSRPSWCRWRSRSSIHSRRRWPREAEGEGRPMRWSRGISCCKGETHRIRDRSRPRAAGVLARPPRGGLRPLLQREPPSEAGALLPGDRRCRGREARGSRSAVRQGARGRGRDRIGGGEAGPQARSGLWNAEIELGRARLFLDQARDADAAAALDRAERVLGSYQGWVSRR